MSLLNRPSDGLLSVFIALRRALFAYGPMPAQRLVDLCAPKTVVGEKPEKARQTLNRWTQLGAFVNDGEKVRLAPELTRFGADDLDALRAAVLRIVLSEKCNPQLGSDDSDDSGNELSLASDLTRAAAWTLMQDVYTTEATWTVIEALHNSQRVGPTLFTNGERWTALAEWASFLGLFMRADARVWFVPAFAVRTVLSTVFDGAPSLHQQPFFERLAEQLPVVDGGRYRLLVERSLSGPFRLPLPTQISCSLSAALLQLEAGGVLRMESRSDASSRVLTGRNGTELRTFSHVRLETP